jgi:large subunit ribosomal protein L4
MELPVKNIRGEEVGRIEVSDSLFNVPMNAALVHQAMVMYRANHRQGTHDTKTRSQVAGGGRKPWRQKYTGRARQGSTRAPQWRHGGVVFGPHPRDYRLRMPAKMRRKALRCVLSEKARGEKLIVVDRLELPGTRTKEMVQSLRNLGATGSTLVVSREKDEALIRSARNLQQVYTLPVELLNAGALLQRENILMTVDAVRRAEELWANEGRKATQPAEEAA